MGVILVSGSAPFAGLPDSPSAALLPGIDGLEVAGHRVQAQELPVSLGLLPGVVATLVDELRPVGWVSLGLAPGEPVLRVETTAINRTDFAVADNEGVRATGGGPIDAGGPPARMATWDAPALAAALNAGGYPTRVSHHAGTHLCNLVLYCALGEMAAAGLNGPCGFFHLPYLPGQVARFLTSGPPGGDTAPLTPRALPSMAFDDQRAALVLLLDRMMSAPGGAAEQGDPAT